MHAHARTHTHTHRHTHTIGNHDYTYLKPNPLALAIKHCNTSHIDGGSIVAQHAHTFKDVITIQYMQAL